MELTIKQEFLIKMFCVIMLLGLCIVIYINGKNLSCDNCVINFKAIKRERDSASNKVYQNFSVSINEIYNSLIEDEYDCLIVFDMDYGFNYKNATEYK